MVINTNINALDAHRDAKVQDVGLRKAQQKLSSGVRINSAADDAAGAAITTKMQAQARGLDRAEMNIDEGIDFLTVADGVAAIICDKLQRVRELAVQAANDTNMNIDREFIDKEVQSLFNGVNDAAENYTYNTIPVAGSDKDYHFQIGANACQSLIAQLKDLSTPKLFPSNDPNDPYAGVPKVAPTHREATEALAKVDRALLYVAEVRAHYGAYMNRLYAAEDTARITSLNTKAAMSRINDADMAKEIMNQSKAIVMTNVSVSMIAQANSRTDTVMSLLS